MRSLIISLSWFPSERFSANFLSSASKLFLILSLLAWGEYKALAEASGSSNSPRSDVLTVFQQEQWALMDEQNALLENGATPDQLASWRKQNAARFEAQLQRAKEISAASIAQPMPLVSTVRIPANASPEMREYLTNQAELNNRLAQLHNQQIRDKARTDSEETAQERFLRENATEIQAQAQRAKVISQQNAQRPLPTPPPPRISANASPELRTLLTEQYQFMMDRIAFNNQYRNATPEVREKALRQWQKQNTTRLQSIQQHAQNLARKTQR